jgi:RNA ligase
MNKFPIINSIDDVLPFVKDKDEFVIVNKGLYTVISYVYIDNNTFDTPISRECRGIIFCNQTGKVIRRPLSKFFNVNERDETMVSNIDWNQPHHILEKLDGSLIAPFVTSDGIIRWGSKLGETDLSNEQVLPFIKEHHEYIHLVEYLNSVIGVTPSFEWLSRKQRIVIDHPEDKLVLLSIRDNETGKYASRTMLEEVSNAFGIPLVKKFNDTHGGIENFIEHTRGLENFEGYVVNFDYAPLIKVKSDWYIGIHRTKEFIAQERRVVDAIINDRIDDVISLLVMDIDRNRVEKYRHKFIKQMKAHYENIPMICRIYKRNYSRKEFALHVAPRMNQVAKGIYFALWDEPTEENLKRIINNIIKKNLTRTKNFARIKEALFKDIVYEEV